VRFKEAERQLFNAANYEVQIRELTEKCFSQEKEIYEYREEYEKLNKICETLYHENEMLKNKLADTDFALKQKYEAELQKNADLSADIDKWRNRYQAAERSKLKELEDLRAMMESQRKSMIDREIREMTIRFQNERSSLENEIRKCRELLDNRAREVEELRQRAQKQEITIMELRNYENLIADHENRLALLNQELLRLNELLRQKDEDNGVLKQKEFKLAQQLKQLQEWEFEGKQLRSGLEAKAREAEEWKTRTSRLEEEVSRARELEHYNEELGNKLNLAAKELERLNGILRSKLEEVEAWKRKVTERESELSKYKNLENELFSYESKINNLKIENDRINGILKSRLSEIEDWKGRYQQVEQQLAQAALLHQEKKALEERCGSQVRQNEELKFQLTRLESDLAGLRKSEGLLKEAERTNGGLSKEIERLNGVLKGQAGELNDFRIRYSKVEGTLAEYKSVEGKVRDYENKIGLLTTELEKLNDLLKERNREIGGLEKEKLELYGKINHYKNYELKIAENEQLVGRMQEGNASLKREIDSWQAKFREADARARDFENHLFRNNQEKEKLSSMVKAKNSDYDELRTQLARLEPEVRRKNELEVALQEQQVPLRLSRITSWAWPRTSRATSADCVRASRSWNGSGPSATSSPSR
jgi:chromosome segregation ATPase